MKNKVLFFSILFAVFSSNCSMFSQNSTQISEEVISLIEKKRIFNEEHGFGFRIQLYSGNEKRAKKFLNHFKSKYPNIFCKLVYDVPNWKVHVGNYKSKLEADKDLIEFKKDYLGIIVIPMGK